MPVIIEFLQDNPGTLRQSFGPYRTAQVDGNAVHVFDELQPFVLATRSPAGQWIVNGLGEEMPFDSFVVMPPWDAARTELDCLAEEEAA